jgi:hypothetical protein
VVVAVAASRRRLSLIEVRAAEWQRFRDEGLCYSEIVWLEERPLVVELLADTIALLHEVSGPFRRVEARALHAEGVTMDRIASLFGVTRQRVSNLVRVRPGARAGSG